MIPSPVQASGLTRRFNGPGGSTVVALDGVDLELARGAFAVVVGPSGCGKSTLLNVLGLLDASDGELLIDGERVADLDAHARSVLRRRSIGFLFQDGGLVEPMTAAQNIELALVYRRLETAARAAHIDRVLSDVGLGDRAGSQVSTLSGGERQRVALARALAASPSILICDEPSASLDEVNTRLIAERLRSAAAQGVTVVCSSHDPLLIAAADIRIEMACGRVVAVAA